MPILKAKNTTGWSFNTGKDTVESILQNLNNEYDKKTFLQQHNSCSNKYGITTRDRLRKKLEERRNNN